MDHMHDELDETDLKFLKQFEELGRDESHDHIDDEGVKQAQDHDPMNQDAPKAKEMGETIDVEMQGDSSGQGKGTGEADGEGEEEGEQGNGDDDHLQNQESDEEGIDQEGDSQEEGKDGDSDSEGDGDEESEQNDRNDEQERGECDGECKPPEDDDEDSEPCPYCTEKNKRKEQRKQNPIPLAMDAWKKPIFMGDEIESCGDGSHQDEFDRYTGVVMGIAYGHKDEDVANRMIVVKRRDGIVGGYEVEGEENQGVGWGVRSNICTVEEDEKQQQEHKHDQDQEEMEEIDEFLKRLFEDNDESEDEDNEEEHHDHENEQEEQENNEEEREDEREIICLDKDGHPLRDGDRVQIVDPQDRSIIWPTGDDGTVHTLRDKCQRGKGGKRIWPGIVMDRDANGSEWECPVTGKAAWTFTNVDNAGNLISIQWLRWVSSPEPDDEPEFDDRKSLPLTKQQEIRFATLFERISIKTKQTFGATLGSAQISPDLPGGVYDGEAVAKYIEIDSRGVTYRVILTASRFEDEKK